MRINYTLDNNNIITSWNSIPFNPNLPYIELDNPEEIHVGFDKIIDNKLIVDNESFINVVNNNSLRQSYQEEIEELKTLLRNSDYKVIKHMEGVLPENEFNEIKTLRQSYRDRINELEKLILEIK